MADPSVIASATGIVIAAITAAVIAIIKAITASKVELLTKSEEIHKLVNSTAAESTAKIAALELKVSNLYTQLQALQERRIEEAKSRPAER